MEYYADITKNFNNLQKPPTIQCGIVNGKEYKIICSMIPKWLKKSFVAIYILHSTHNIADKLGETHQNLYSHYLLVDSLETILTFLFILFLYFPNFPSERILLL